MHTYLHSVHSIFALTVKKILLVVIYSVQIAAAFKISKLFLITTVSSSNLCVFPRVPQFTCSPVSCHSCSVLSIPVLMGTGVKAVVQTHCHVLFASVGFTWPASGPPRADFRPQAVLALLISV